MRHASTLVTLSVALLAMILPAERVSVQQASAHSLMHVVSFDFKVSAIRPQ